MDRADTPHLQPWHRRSWVRGAAEIPILVAIAVVIVFLLKTFLAQAFFIPSESMVPQLQVGDRVVVSRTAYHLHQPRRGDVIVFPEPGSDTAKNRGLLARAFGDVIQATGVAKPDDNELIKRIVGLPGERVEAKGGRVYIDQAPLVEPYLADDEVQADFGPIRVPEGHVWVMGDNRDNSSDSRVFGAVEIDTIVGRAVAVVWPPGRAEFL